jgi:hypothetical protein
MVIHTSQKEVLQLSVMDYFLRSKQVADLVVLQINRDLLS